MDFIRVSIFTTTEGIESVSGRLYQLGVNGIEIEDETDFLEFMKKNKEYWDYIDDELIEEKCGETRIKLYIQDNEHGKKMLEEVYTSMAELKAMESDVDFGRLEISLDTIKEEDWANNWKQYYNPIEIGDKILIKPSWQELPDPTDRIVFENNPGASFGTGMHFSTQLCLEAIEKNLKSGDIVLDIGCGSGILSIIAMLLGAKKALAVDVDPNSVDVATENAVANKIDLENYKVISGNILNDLELQTNIGENKYDVVLANIVADVIIELANFVSNFIKTDGIFIASGIIDLRIDDVLTALKEANFEIVQLARRGDWAAVTCKVKA